MIMDSKTAVELKTYVKSMKLAKSLLMGSMAPAMTTVMNTLKKWGMDDLADAPVVSVQSNLVEPDLNVTTRRDDTHTHAPCQRMLSMVIKPRLDDHGHPVNNMSRADKLYSLMTAMASKPCFPVQGSVGANLTCADIIMPAADRICGALMDTVGVSREYISRVSSRVLGERELEQTALVPNSQLPVGPNVPNGPVDSRLPLGCVIHESCCEFRDPLTWHVRHDCFMDTKGNLKNVPPPPCITGLREKRAPCITFDSVNQCPTNW